MDTAWTIPVSLGGSFALSLLGTYLGIRWFTGPRIRAEQAQTARRAIRDAVSPLRQEVRVFRAGRAASRDAGIGHPEDGVLAERILQLSHDLPKREKARVERRLDAIFATAFMDTARMHDSTVGAPEERTASQMTVAALFANREGKQVSFVDGLLQQGLEGAPDGEKARDLDAQLELLAACR